MKKEKELTRKEVSKKFENVEKYLWKNFKGMEIAEVLGFFERMKFIAFDVVTHECMANHFNDFQEELEKRKGGQRK